MIGLLVVDDQPVFRNGLAILLKENSVDFDVVGVTSCTEEAIVKVQQLRPDVVIIGIGREAGHDIDIVQMIGNMFPEVKLLVLADSDEEADLFRAIKAGASAYLLKTVDFDELAVSIRRLMAGEHVLSPLLVNKLFTEVRNGSSEKDKKTYMLTDREKDILKYAGQGYSNKEIAEHCFVTLATVKSHFRNILKKLEVKNRTGAVAVANTYALLPKVARPPTAKTQ